MAVTGGDDWRLYYDIIERCGTFYTYVFLLFTFTFVFALFNILTGVIVEKAVSATQVDRDELILEQCLKSRKEADEFRALCKRLDTDSSGSITFEEFLECMEDERMVSYMATVGLEVHDVELFFKIVAKASSNDDRVDIDKFVEGCMSMRGGASGLDMQKSLYETSRLQARLRAMEETLSGRIVELLGAVQQLGHSPNTVSGGCLSNAVALETRTPLEPPCEPPPVDAGRDSPQAPPESFLPLIPSAVGSDAVTSEWR